MSEPTKPNKNSKGDGSTYQRKDGRWVAEIPLPDEDGKRRSKVRYAKTEAQAKAKLTELRREKIKNDGDLPTGSMRVSALMDRWYTEVAEKTHKPKTAANERSVIRNHIKPAIGKVSLENLSRLHFERLSASIEAKGLGSATMILAHSTLSSAVQYAFKSDLITSNIAAKATRPTAAEPTLEVLTAEQGKRLLQVTSGDRLGSRIAAAILTGARQGELIGLELERLRSTIVLDWQLQRVTRQHGCGIARAEEYTNKASKPAVRYHWPCGMLSGSRCPDGKYVFPRNSEHRQLDGGLFLVRPKTKKGYRVLPLSAPMRAVIERRLQESAGEPNPHGLLWTSDPKRSRHGVEMPLDGSPIDPRIDNEYWHRSLVRAGLETEGDKKLHLHSARHTGASLFLAANVPEKTVMELMGHSTYVVLRRYQHISQDQGLAAMEGMASELGYVPGETLALDQ